MVHHSATADGATFSWQAIRVHHVETNRWNAIGYHAGVELVGRRYEALIGRGLHVPAAACPQGGMNDLALHVCCVGNFDTHRPPAEQLAVLLDVVVWPWMKLFGIPRENVIGHRDFNRSKSCPGSRFDLEELRGRL